MNTSENDVIARFTAVARSGASGGQLRLGIGDDGALFAPRPGYETIVTCDWFLEGTHFLRNLHPADAIGWKCLVRALSDIAAMGGAPKCFVLSLALPSGYTGEWLSRFLRGLRRAARKFACPLAGGDTTERREILISITALGEVRKGQAILRSGAKPGDAIFVSGVLGEADLGLKLLRRAGPHGTKTDSALRKHLYPEPRLGLGKWLSNRRLASAMMDLSDGLSTDLTRLCRASGIGARMEAAKLPSARLSESAGRSEIKNLDPISLVLNGGDDYELLFTVPQRAVRRIPNLFQGIPLTPIGEITRDRRVMLVTPNSEVRIASGGWDPFRRRSK
jgi:thiamine-monophosphate kinase